MLSPHADVAIAQTVFYAPIVPITIYILIRNWRHGPRMAWYPLVLFSLMRIAGGITVILWSKDTNNLGLIIASIILLNLGLIPLIITLLFLTRFIIVTSFPEDKRALRVAIALRYAIFGAIGLLIASGSLIGKSGLASTQRGLTQAGYIVLFVILCIIIAMVIRLRSRRSLVAASDRVYIELALITTPLLLLRAVYGLLYAFTSSNIVSMWNPLFGSAIAFALMALLPEYIALMIYIYLGFYRLRTSSQLTSVNRSEQDMIMS